MKNKRAVSFVWQAYVLITVVCYKQKHLKCVRVQNRSLRMRRQRNSFVCSVFYWCFFGGPVAVLYMWSSEWWAKGNNHSSLPNGCAPMSESRSGTEHDSNANRAGVSPARAASHCTWARQVVWAQGWQMGSAPESRSPHKWWWCSLRQVLKSIHRSESSPAVVTSVPTIARQVYSDGAELKSGQKVNPQVKALINRVHGQAQARLGQS